jgi:Phage integrase family
MAPSPTASSRSFARLARDLGLPDLRFHDLRYDAASTLTMAGVPQRTIMAILGHRDPVMTFPRCRFPEASYLPIISDAGHLLRKRLDNNLVISLTEHSTPCLLDCTS